MQRVISRGKAQKAQASRVGTTHREVAGGGPSPGRPLAATPGTRPKRDDDVIDAEFEVKK